jgi:tetraacyldisaccharide 4'-kinase
LLRLGWKPGILTRGYGRRGRELIALHPAIGGTERVVDPRTVGDEAALLARALPGVPIVVCADRYRGGRLAGEQLNVNVHILDDGFQYLALARDVDVVVLDVTQELSERALLPAGRLREPPSALQRADLVVFSRTELGDPEKLASQVAQINPAARMFRSTTKLCGLREIPSGRTSSPGAWQSMAVQAFCGLGNPQAFFADLRRWGFTLTSEETFADHHLYTAREFRRLSMKARKAGARALITTEKDAWNFPSYWKPDLPILVCEIQAEVEEARDFEGALEARLKSEAGG